MRKYIYKLLLSLQILAIIAIPAQAHQNTQSANHETQITSITIASEPDYPPFCFIDEKGEAKGFSIDLFNEATKTVGLKVEIKIGVWNKIRQDLADSKIDALPLVGKTPERENLYDFSMTYLSLHGAVFVRQGTTGINTISDLKNKSIVVMKGDNAEEFVRRENISDQIYTTNTFEEAFRRLAEGEYDVVITQRVMGLKLLESRNITSVVALNIQLPSFKQEFCFAVKKGNTQLLDKLNEGLSVIIANKKYDEIREKWFGPTVKEKLSVTDVLPIVLYTLIPIVFASFIFFIVFLKREVKKRTLNLEHEISEHKKTVDSLSEQQILLHESENKFRNLFENHTAIKLLVEKKTGKIIDANKSAVEFYGWSADQLKQMNMSQINILSVEEIQKEIQAAKENNKSYYEFRHKRADGSIRNVDVYSSRINLVDREYTHAIVFDSTERKQAELNIKQNLERLNRLLKIYEYSSTNVQDFLDFSLTQAIQLTSSRIGYIFLYDEEKQEFFLNSWSKEVMEECKISDYQLKVSLDKTGLWGEAVRQRKEILLNDYGAANPLKKGYPEGHVKISKFLSLPVFDDDKIVAVVGVGNKQNNYDETDAAQLRILMNGIWRIVKRKEAEEEVATLIKAVEQNPVSVIITDPSGSIEYVNPKFTETTGYSFEEALGQNPKILKSGDEPEEFYKELWEAVLAGETWAGVFHNKKKNGELFWESASISPIKDIAGNITHLVAVKEDITEKVEKDIQLEEYREHLEELVDDRTAQLSAEIKEKEKIEQLLKLSLIKEKELNELKSRFISTASHEFRTPLTVIYASAELIKRYGNKWSQEKIEERISKIVNSVDYLTNLINEVLIISKADEGKININNETIDLHQFCMQLIEDLKMYVGGRHNINLRFHCENNYHTFDPKHIYTIIQNLVSNACKYSGEGSDVDLFIDCKSEHLIFTVQDNGIGIPVSELTYIYERFHRASNSETIEGTGLGLSIVKSLVDLLGGEIKVESELGRGTRFTVSIPCAQSEFKFSEN